MDIFDVVLSRRAKKELRGVPRHIVDKLETWTKAVAREGLRRVQEIPGYHDEPLKGDRLGQRSIRLNRAYRAIYVIKRNGKIEFLLVEEVSKHDY